MLTNATLINTRKKNAPVETSAGSVLDLRVIPALRGLRRFFKIFTCEFTLLVAALHGIVPLKFKIFAK